MPSRNPPPLGADLDDVARTLCRLATLSFALGEVDRCRDSVDAAEALLIAFRVRSSIVLDAACLSAGNPAQKDPRLSGKPE